MIIVNGQQYNLASKRTGEYSGPCPFGVGGEDRTSIWSHSDGSINFYCRKECRDCRGQNIERCSHGGTKGWIPTPETTGEVVEPEDTPAPGMDKVLDYHGHLNQLTVDYLATRGVTSPTIDKFLIGTNERRFTIPCLAGGKCHGIKKRWIGEPPEKWISRYVLVPGSKAVALYNFDRLQQRIHWDFFLVVESLMDVLVLEQIGIPSIAPFGGGGVWNPAWNPYFDKVDNILHVADTDVAGLEYAYKRRTIMDRGYIVQAPGATRFGFSDINEAYVELGPNVIRNWIAEKLGEYDG